MTAEDVVQMSSERFLEVPLIKPPEGGGCYDYILGVIFTIANFVLNLVKHLRDIKKK